MKPAAPAAVFLLLLVMHLATPLMDPAHAAVASSERRLCRDINFYNTPGGFVVALAYRRERVRVLRRSANRRWVHVRRRSDGAAGWVTSGALCRA